MATAEIVRPTFDRVVDLMDPATHAGDVWPLYTWLREDARLYWDSINELWCVARYDDIVEVARDPDTWCSTEGNVPKMPPDPSFINLDGREHKLRRGLVQGYFTGPAIAKLEQHITDAVDKLIDEVIEAGECDFVTDIAAPLPLQLIGEMTGIPDDLRPFVLEWMDTFVQGGNGPTHVTEEVNEAFINFGALHMMMVDERRETPTDDLLSLWVHAEVDGKPLDEDQLLFEHTMMMIGGSETARNAISGAVHALSALPEQKQLLLDHPDKLANGAEEAIRYVTPFVRMSRTAAKDTELLGQPVKKGDEIIMLYPAANRDPRKFDNPHAFDVDRKFKNKSVSFGYGRHFCIGAMLARAEVRITLQQLLKRMPDWQTGEPVYTISSFIRGLKSLPMTFTPGKRLN